VPFFLLCSTNSGHSCVTSAFSIYLPGRRLHFFVLLRRDRMGRRTGNKFPPSLFTLFSPLEWTVLLSLSLQYEKVLPFLLFGHVGDVPEGMNFYEFFSTLIYSIEYRPLLLRVRCTIRDDLFLYGPLLQGLHDFLGPFLFLYLFLPLSSLSGDDWYSFSYARGGRKNTGCLGTPPPPPHLLPPFPLRVAT